MQQRITEVVKGPMRDDDLVRVSARLVAAGWPLGSPAPGDVDAGPDVGSGSGPVARVVEWLRAGYPAGLPERDVVPLIALLRRRLTDQEVGMVARRLLDTGVPPSGRVDIGAAIAKVTAELPSEEDMERVQAALAEEGWPVDLA